MADTLTTTTQVDPAVSVFYDRVLLKAATANLVHLKWAQHARLDKKNGNTYKWRRYANLTAATTPLAEGVNPPGQLLSKSDLTAQVSWYGDFVHITDVIDMTVEDAVLTVAASKLGEQADRTFDTLMRDILVASASSTNASGGSNGNTPTEITRADVDSIVKTMLGNDAKLITSMMMGGSGQGTTPVRAAFRAIVKTILIDDLEDCAGFKPISEYPSQKDVDGMTEWGSVGNVRFHQTSIGHASSDSPVQYKIPIIGQDAYGDVTLEGMKNIVKGFGSAGTADPLDREASSGWKKVWAARILNDSFVHLLVVTHS